MKEKSTITIGIPVDAALKDERTGVEEYTFQLVSQFLRLSRPEGAPSGRYKFILYTFQPEKAGEIFKGATIVSAPYQRFWFQRVLPFLIAESKPDVFFSPASSLPRGLFVPAVATIHGMEWHNTPKHYSFSQRLQQRTHTKNILKRAQGIIAVSEHTKKGIELFSPRHQASIAVIHHGAEIPVRLLIKKHNDNSWRFLFVGRKDKRKNLKGMVGALAIVKRLAPDVAFTFSAIGPLGNDSFAKKNHETMQNVFVSEEEKMKHYNNADIFLFPSHDEGFGMPIVEAQAQGVPVVCSSFLKEVAGEGAIYCEPDDPKTIASAILTLMLHPAVYAEKRKAARANAKRFSWAKCARETLEFLEQQC